MSHLSRSFAPAALALFAGAASAQLDNNVQWALISHSAQSDRRPLAPMNGETFDVLFQTARDDLTAARVLFDPNADGIDIQTIAATKTGTRGDYDLWRATLPAAAVTRTAYALELVDGTDADYFTPAGVSDNPPAVSAWWMLNFTTMEHAPLGATPRATGTFFRVWAPNATSAQVRGTFNSWGSANPMTRQGEFFTAWVPAARAGGKYKYYFNGNLWKPDARARQIDNNDGYNSVIVDPLSYTWTVPNFVPAPRDRWVVYQLHVGSFSGLNDPRGSFTRAGTFREVAARADHLQELGINAVMLNPVNEFPGSQSGGYNSITMWGFETSHGTANDFKFMIDALHARGIAVILDVIWNHFGPTDNYLWNYDGTQIYFDSPAAVDTPWGPQADFDRPQVFSYFLDSAEHVLGEFKLDGYRQDALFEITGATQAISGQNLMRQLMSLVRRRFNHAHVIGEIYDNSAWNTSPAGIDLHGQYHEAFKNAIKDAIDAAALGNPDMARLAASIDGSGPFVEGERVLNYFELHDDAWPLNNTQRAVRRMDTTAPHDDRFATGRTKLAQGITLLSKGMPAILMGTEWLESNGFESQKIDWSKKTTYAQIFRFYRELIALRTTQPALFANADCRVYHVNDASNVLAFERSVPGGGSYVVLANFSNNDFASYSIGLPRAGAWGVVMNSEDAIYRGRGVGAAPGCVSISTTPRDGFNQSVSLALPAHGFLLLQHEPPFTPPTITQNPADRTLEGDGSASFSAAATSNESIALRWQRQLPSGGFADVTDGVFILSGGTVRFQNSNTSTLTVTTTGVDAGTELVFRAVATAGCGTAFSNPASLRVLCRSDFDRSGFTDSDDFVLFVDHFSRGCTAPGLAGETPDPACVRSADFDNTGFIDSDDFVAFVTAFESGC